MSDPSRSERLIREWLDGSDHPRSTEPLINAVLDAIPSAGQESTSRTSRTIRRYAAAGGLVAATLVVSVAGLALVLRPGPAVGPAASPSPSVAPTPTASPSPSTGRSLPPGVIAIDMGEETWALAVDDASVWVQVSESDIGRIDRATNTDTGTRVHEVPAMQFEAGDLWALDIGTGIVRLDPVSGAVRRTIPGISGYYIVVDGRTAWVTDVGHTVDRVDLDTGKVVASIDVPAGPKEMAVYEGSVWVTCDAGGVVARIDIATNDVVAEIAAGNRPVNLAVGEGSVWVWNHVPQLLRIDPATNDVIATINGVAQTLGVGVAVGGGSVWVAVPTGIGRIDPATNDIVEVIPIGPGGYVDLAWFDGELWASSTDQNAVYRIDPSP
jgi:streptogramin lyase